MKYLTKILHSAYRHVRKQVTKFSCNLEIVTWMAVVPFKRSDLGRFRHTGAKVDHNVVSATLAVCNYSTQDEKIYPLSFMPVLYFNNMTQALILYPY